MYRVLGSVVFVVVVMRSCVLFRSGARTARRQPASCSRGGRGGGGGRCRGVLGVVLVVFANSCGLANCRVRSVFCMVVVACCSCVFVFAVGRCWWRRCRRRHQLISEMRELHES